MFLDSLCSLCVSLYKASPLFRFALFRCGIYGFVWDSDHNVKMFLLFQYTLCCIFVLVLIKKLLYLFSFFKENPLDNVPALRLMTLSICSAVDAVFHPHYCHVWPSAGTSPTLLPGDHLSSLYDGFNGKRHCEVHLFFILFYVFGTAVCAVSYFTFWTELFLSVGCLFVTINMECRMEIKVCHNTLPLCPICGNT